MMEEKKEKPLYKDFQIIIWVIALLISLTFLFVPIGWWSTDSGLTNIQYGLEIEGGSTIYLELGGAVAQVDAAPQNIVKTMTAAAFPSGIEITGSNISRDGAAYVTFKTADPVNKTALEHLFNSSNIYVTASGGISEVNMTSSKTGFITSYLAHVYGTEVVPYSRSGGSVEYEIRTKTTENQLAGHMQAVNGSILTDYSGKTHYRDGTTAETVQTMIAVLNNKLGNGLGVKDLPIRSVSDQYIQIDFAGKNLTDARELVETPGRFEIRIQTTENETAHVLYGDSIESVGIIGQDPATRTYSVPFTLNDDGARKLQQIAVSAGATINPEAHNLTMVLDENEIYSAPLSRNAAIQLNTQPIYSWQAGIDSLDNASELQIHLRSGALPVSVEIVNAGQIEATLGQSFLKGAILTGIISVLAVTLIVYNRYYKNRKIVLPMVMVSLSEVVLILGFSVLIGQQLDLATLAGIIAVTGTGIDHMLIITEEMLHEGKMPSGKIYLARIKNAFKILLGSAATTVIAMVPLMILGFGALKGFALTTIFGVLVGVLIARPAYSAILRHMLTKRGLVHDELPEHE
ncbi:MAG: preprotein translocase subunit SecD [Methanosarcinales archaeon]|jgi:preprotein translocase subunit SecD|nr:preprotein translocase subunit SecD [Methanosarcinales archaeon]